MKALAARIDAYWRAPAPAERLAAVRILVGLFAAVYLAARIPDWLSYATFEPGHFRPVGVVTILDRPLLPNVVRGIAIATVLLSIPFLLGWRFRITGPLFAISLLWMLSYRNSWGMVFHTENLMVMQVLALALAPSADAWSLDARRRGRPVRDPAPRYGWPLRLMCWIVVIAYVLAGIAKIRNAGGAWLWGNELRNYVAIDNVRKLLLGDAYSPLAGPLLQKEWLFKLTGLITVLFELGAPLALLGRRLAAAWVIVAVGFHWAVLALMYILFPYPMFGVAFACFFRVERPGRWLARRWRRRPGA